MTAARLHNAKLESQLTILNGYKGAAFFVPGNHDWWNITYFKKGKRKLKMEESFIEAKLAKNLTIANPNGTFYPKDGMPGPTSVELDNKKVRIVFIDTYWLILLGFKQNPKENFIIANTFYHNLDSIFNAATELQQTIIAVAHHPIYSTGKALAKKFKNPYFFERPKQSFKTFPSYDSMIVKMTAIFQKYPGIYYASGHIHALQFHFVNGVNYIISGSGSKTIKVKSDGTNQNHCAENDCELWNEKGFFEMDFYKDYSPSVIMYHQDGKENTLLKKHESTVGK